MSVTLVTPGASRRARGAHPVTAARSITGPVRARSGEIGRSGVRSRTPGVHREPGVSFWRITWREFVWMATWGGVRLWVRSDGAGQI